MACADLNLAENSLKNSILPDHNSFTGPCGERDLSCAMASKSKSKWVDDEQELVESIEQRKREKEKKKQMKEEKLRKAAAAQEASKLAEPAVQSTIHGE